MTVNRQSSFANQDTASMARSELPAVLHEDSFWPTEPTTVGDTGLSDSLIESLTCQVLLAAGTLSGRRVAESLGLPFGIVDQQLAGMRTRQIVAHARSAPLNDYYYGLTEHGQKRTLQPSEDMHLHRHRPRATVGIRAFG